METPNEPKEVKIIHVQIVGGTHADVYEIGQAMRKLRELLPYRLEAVITNENITLKDVDSFIADLWKLKKQIDQEKRLK